jgi:LemA protein
VEGAGGEHLHRSERATGERLLEHLGTERAAPTGHEQVVPRGSIGRRLMSGTAQGLRDRVHRAIVGAPLESRAAGRTFAAPRYDPRALRGEQPMTAALSFHRLRAAGLALLATLALSGCGYNDFQRLDESVKAAWSEVLNQYQRRADLIPNIVNTVKGEANFEQETLTKVVEARAKATSIQVTPETINNPEAFNKFQAAQGELSSALSRLIAVSENYPNLKTNQGFQDLRVQLEGTENRITVARNRYIKAVADYNVLTRSFPSNLTAMIFSYSVKPTFTVENEAAISRPPAVSFDKPASAAK